MCVAMGDSFYNYEWFDDLCTWPYPCYACEAGKTFKKQINIFLLFIYY